MEPRRVIDEGRTATGSAPPPARPQLVLRARTSTSLHLEWEEPDDHGDEIYLYVLQMAEHEVTWQERTADFFDGYRPATPRDGRLQPRASPLQPDGAPLLHTAHGTLHTTHRTRCRPWRLVHEGPATVRTYRLGGLKPANAHMFRLVATNGGGTSEQGEASFVTAGIEQGARGNEAVPRGWLANDLADIVAEYIALTDCSSFEFLAEARTRTYMRMRTDVCIAHAHVWVGQGIHMTYGHAYAHAYAHQQYAYAGGQGAHAACDQAQDSLQGVLPPR